MAVSRLVWRSFSDTTPARPMPDLALRALPGALDIALAVQAFDRIVEVAHEAAAAEFAIGEDCEAQFLLTFEHAQNRLIFKCRCVRVFAAIPADAEGCLHDRRGTSLLPPTAFMSSSFVRDAPVQWENLLVVQFQAIQIFDEAQRIGARRIGRWAYRLAGGVKIRFDHDLLLWQVGDQHSLVVFIRHVIELDCVRAIGEHLLLGHRLDHGSLLRLRAYRGSEYAAWRMSSRNMACSSDR